MPDSVGLRKIKSGKVGHLLYLVFDSIAPPPNAPHVGHPAVKSFHIGRSLIRKRRLPQITYFGAIGLCPIRRQPLENLRGWLAIPPRQIGPLRGRLRWAPLKRQPPWK